MSFLPEYYLHKTPERAYTVTTTAQRPSGGSPPEQVRTARAEGYRPSGGLPPERRVPARAEGFRLSAGLPPGHLVSVIPYSRDYRPGGNTEPRLFADALRSTAFLP